MSVFSHTEYRGYLRGLLSDRIQKNPRYSLRALARHFGISASLLSKVNRGQKNLSHQSALKICDRLGLGSKESDYFCCLVQYETAREESVRSKLLERIQVLNKKRQIHSVPLDQFKLISEWYHLPILEMTRLHRFQFTPAKVARKLGIKPIEAETAIERLFRLGLLVRSPQGKVTKSGERILSETLGSSEALQTYYRQMLSQAAGAFAGSLPQERYFASDVYSIDPSQIIEARARIDDCMNDLIELFERGKRKTETYQLGVQLFRLTRKDS